MKWLGNNFLNIIVLAILLYVVFKPKDTTVEQYKLEQLRSENDALKKQRDSINAMTKNPVVIFEDTLAKQAIELNRKTLYELRNKNAAHIDTAGSDELKRIFAGYQ